MILGAGFGQGQKQSGVELGANYLISKIDFKTRFPNMEVHEFNQTTETKGEYLKALSQFVRHSQRTDGFTLTIGGDHTIGASTVSGAILGEVPHLVWIDAHADANDHIITPTGNWHGMPVSMLLNGGRETTGDNQMSWLPRIFNSSNISYIGLREVDQEEFKRVRQLCVQYFTIFELKNMSYNHIAYDIRSRSLGKPLHISIDLDCLDPHEFNSTGCYTPNGMTIDMLLNIIIELFATHHVAAVDIVEFNPLLGNVEDALIKIDQIISIIAKLVADQSKIA